MGRNRSVSTFTDAGVNASQIEDTRQTEPVSEVEQALGIQRFHFDLLLGESRIWTTNLGLWRRTDDGLYVCDGCGQSPDLEVYAYCLNCDRSGRDAQILPPSALELAKLRGRKQYKPDKALAGGTGKPLTRRVKRRAG